MTVSILCYEEGKEAREFDDLSGLASLGPNMKVWIDIQSDSSEELAATAEHFELHELTLEDCLTPGHFPKIDDYGAYLFMIFRGLKSWSEVEDRWNAEDDESADNVEDQVHERYSRKVAIYLSGDFIITHRRREVLWLDALVRQAKQYPERFLAEGTVVVAHKVIDVLVDRFMRGLGFFDRLIDEYEQKSIEHPETFEVVDLLELKHELTSLRQTLRNQRAIITRLSSDPTLIRDRDIRQYFRDIDDHSQELIRTADTQLDALLAIRDSFFALANVRLGDTMRILTVITTIAALLNIVVGLYGMNFHHIPLSGYTHGFWFVVSAMIILALGMFLYFRKRRWL
jgi:magnesium transporter